MKKQNQMMILGLVLAGWMTAAQAENPIGIPYPICSSTLPAGALCVNQVGGDVSRVVSVKQTDDKLQVVTKKLSKKELKKLNELYSGATVPAVGLGVPTGDVFPGMKGPLPFSLENGITVVPPCATGMPVGTVCLKLNGKFAKVKTTKEGKTILLRDGKTAEFEELSADDQVKYREEMIRQTTRREVEMEFMEKQSIQKNLELSGCSRQGNKIVCGDGVYIKQVQGVTDAMTKKSLVVPADSGGENGPGAEVQKGQ